MHRHVCSKSYISSICAKQSRESCRKLHAWGSNLPSPGTSSESRRASPLANGEFQWQLCLRSNEERSPAAVLSPASQDAAVQPCSLSCFHRITFIALWWQRRWRLPSERVHIQLPSQAGVKRVREAGPFQISFIFKVLEAKEKNNFLFFPFFFLK